jgi:diguanylate cyclase (GGDEF)-like protein
MNDEKRGNRLLEQLYAFGRHEFGRRSKLLGTGDMMDKLGLAMNVLGEELSATTAARDAVHELNESLRQANLRLEQLTRLDPLTRVLNRRGLEEMLVLEARRAERDNSAISVLLIDCDDFKRINDHLGHAVGDLVLQDIAQRMSSTLRIGDHAGRIGGDEFLAILPATRHPEALVAAERMRMGVCQFPIRVGSKEVTITVSVGVACLPPGVAGIEEVLTQTRAGLVRSKLSGKNQVFGSTEGEHGGELGNDLNVLVNELRAGQGMRAVAQAILTSGGEEVIGFEMLSRRDKGPFSAPLEFFQVALEQKMLASVDLLCAATCLKEASARNLSGRLHFNLFPSTLLATPPERLMSIFPPQRNGEVYCVEISEQQFIGDPISLKASLAELRSNGVLIGVDDVGFGRTSLETLLVVEPDIIKIDRHYVHGVADDPAKAKRLQRMLSAVGRLDAEIVAEGVERREDLEVLTDLGLPYVQGYLWGQPC